MDGSDLEKGEERENRRPEIVPAWRGTMAGGEEVIGERETRTLGHGSTNRGSRGREEMKATSPRPRTWPEDAVGGVVAVAGDAKVPGARKMGPRGHETRN